MLNLKGALSLVVGFLIALILAQEAPANAVSDGSDSVCIGGACYYPIDSGSYFGDGKGGGLVNDIKFIKSVDGKIQVQESNLCPQGFQGGELYGLQGYDLGVMPVISIGGKLYLQWYFDLSQPTGLEGVSVSYGPSDSLNVPYGPIPQTFPLVTIAGLKSTSAYAFIAGQTCYYRTCSCQVPTGCGCEFNAAFSEVIINTPLTPPAPKVELVKTITNPGTGVTEGSSGSVSMVPSVQACGEMHPSASSRAIFLQCVDATTKNPVAGCSVSYSLTLGSNNGGHGHPGRPIGSLTPGPGSMSIPEAGLTINYLAPEVAGDVILNLNVTGSDGSNLNAGNTTFSIKSSTAFIPIVADGLSVVTASHPNQGVYGTPAMLKAVQRMTKEYYEHDSIGSNAHRLESQAVSLPWGGLFDWLKNWRAPHCAHRNGNEIDLSLISTQLTSDEQLALRDAIYASKMKFFVKSESLDTTTCIGPQTKDCANHWHATLP